MDSSIFARRFRQAMDKKHLKQIELVRLAEAKGFKLGKSQLSQYLSGKTLQPFLDARFDGELFVCGQGIGKLPENDVLCHNRWFSCSV